MQKCSVSIIFAVGPGKESVLDTLDSIEHYCRVPHEIVLIDDMTKDGTYEALLKNKRPNWHIVRLGKFHGYLRLTRTLAYGFNYGLDLTESPLIMKMDTDALIIRPDILSEALHYTHTNSDVGMFGIYENDYNRPRDFSMQRSRLNRTTARWKQLLGFKPFYTSTLHRAEKNGYIRGENVFGGAYFITRNCLLAIRDIGALDIPYGGRSFCRLAEDAYFSMATLAAGYKLGHFAAPQGPLCMEYKGLPYPAEKLYNMGYKVIHSMDKGKNTQPEDNNGVTAREYFRRIRQQEKVSI